MTAETKAALQAILIVLFFAVFGLSLLFTIPVIEYYLHQWKVLWSY